MRTGATPGETVSDEAVLEAVAAEAGWMEDLLVRLVEAPTTLGDEEAGQRIMEQAFADCGLEPRSVPLDAEALRNAEGASPFSWDVRGKRNVVAGWQARGSGGRSLILNGHVDVVPPAAEALWTNPPFQAVRVGDWLYGRGAGDMKAGLAAMTGAVRALKSAGYAPAADVQLQSVVEEECTGHGALQCLLDGVRADACVITEPHPDHITVAQVGVLWFHVELAGVPAHAARASHLGFNAIDAAVEVLAALRRHEARLNENPPAPFDALRASHQSEPWCDLRRRLALYRRGDVYALLPHRAVPGAGSGGGARRGRGGDRRSRGSFAPAGRESAARALRRVLVRGLGHRYGRAARPDPVGGVRPVARGASSGARDDGHD